MSRSLHWTLMLGCAWLTALFAQPAWVALTTGVPGTAAVLQDVTARGSASDEAELATELLGLVPDLEGADREPEPLAVERS